MATVVESHPVTFGTNVVNLVAEYVIEDHISDFGRKAKERRGGGVLLSAIIIVSCKYIDCKSKVLHLVQCFAQLTLIAEFVPLGPTRSWLRDVLGQTMFHDEEMCACWRVGARCERRGECKRLSKHLPRQQQQQSRRAFLAGLTKVGNKSKRSTRVTSEQSDFHAVATSHCP